MRRNERSLNCAFIRSAVVAANAGTLHFSNSRVRSRIQFRGLAADVREFCRERIALRNRGRGGMPGARRTRSLVRKVW
jgi:hypothetical protein